MPLSLPVTAFYAKWGAVYRALLLTRQWPVRTHLLASLFFFVQNVQFTLRIFRNLFNPTCGQSLAALTLTITSYKRFHCLIPDPVQRQLKAFFQYLGRNILIARRTTLPLTRTSAVATHHAALKHYFYSPAKFRQSHLLNYRKHFRLWQRDYFRKLKHTFYLGKVRPTAVKRLLARFVGKSLLSVGLAFSLNPILLLTKVFPFFDRFFVRQLISAGLVWVNFSQLQPKTFVLKVGDFVHLIWSPVFSKLYFYWLARQQSYHFLMSRSLYHYYKSQRRVSLTRRKNYTRRFSWYPHIYKKTPAWLEVNYVSLSFLIITAPRKLTFTSYNFNPFLNRLLAF